jgi:hypothetical protein
LQNRSLPHVGDFIRILASHFFAFPSARLRYRALLHQTGSSRLRRISCTSSIQPHCSQRYGTKSIPEDSEVKLAIFVTLHAVQERRSISGLLSSFALFTSPSIRARPAGGWVWVRSATGRAQHMSDSKVWHIRSQSRLKPFRLLCCPL